MRNCLPVREFVREVIFPRKPNCSYSALRIHVQPDVEALKEKWGI
jgi:hypothetical protein